MKALSALRQALDLKKNEELGKKFSPEQLKRIVEAIQEYAASKCAEQRTICRYEFETAYESEDCGNEIPSAVIAMYMTGALKESESPDFD